MNLTHLIQQHVRQNRYRSIWNRFVRVLACIVVFCTTYALILPVITMDRTYTCGLELHAHSQACYSGGGPGPLLCTPEALGVHTHSGGCYDSDGNLRCGYADRIIHTHDALCMDEEGTLICTIPEALAHSHGPECFSGEALVCGMTALTAHTHTDDCRDEAGTLVCGMDETISHQHTAACAVRQTTEPELICGLEVHDHTSDCIAATGFSLRAAGDSANVTLVFTSWSEWNPIDFPNGNNYTCQVGSVMTITVQDPGTGANYIAPVLELTGAEAVSVTATCSDSSHGNHAGVNWCTGGLTHTFVIRITGTSATIRCSLQGANWVRESNSVTISDAGGTVPTDPPTTAPTETLPPETEPTEPEPTETVPTEPEPTETEPEETLPPETEPEETEPTRPGYPTAVKTGKSSVDTLRFYNFSSTGGSLAPLSGCVFEITGTANNGQAYRRTIVSGDSAELVLPADIPEGTYTITELSAPENYIRDVEPSRTFTVSHNETLGCKSFGGSNTIGIFLNHSTGELKTGKTAEVENYNQRTYEIILNAQSSINLYDMEPIDVLFVVDQSNSMLFPSGLEDTGKSVTLYASPENNWWGNQNLNAINGLGLDTSQVYYIIADPTGSSTVFALWYNNGTWLYQDASYYAKAWHNNAEGYRQDDEMAAFPTDGEFQGTWTTNGVNYKANGGGLGYTIGGSLGTYITGQNGSNTFTIYTATDRYNRLHYLEESLSQAIYMLSEANAENTVTLIRFTKEVDEAHCEGPLALNPVNTETLVNHVNKIQTDGGTRQDLALEHAYQHLTGTHKTGATDLFTKDRSHTFTILITDGAPVRSGSNAPSLDNIYANIVTQAENVKNPARGNSTLVTIGLGMGSVERGGQVLEDIADEPHDFYANMLEDAADLTDTLYKLLTSTLTPTGEVATTGDITDVISNSFYPIAWVSRGSGPGTGRNVLYSDDTRDWILLEPGDFIDLEGGYIPPDGSSAYAGQLLRQADGSFYIQWIDRNLSNPSWEGRFFVKAREDFIGGNAIDTNQSAHVAVDNTVLALPVPTVNVRLLDLNQGSSEVTVFLGDTINETADSPLDSLRYFWNNTYFTKLIADFADGNVNYGPIMNALDPGASETDGLETGVFFLKYALGRDLTAEEWKHLTASEDNTVTIDYTYDDASSHGSVGYFTFRLTRSGETADYDAHTATLAGDHVEEYILHVTYTAYELGEAAQDGTPRPSHNVHNGSGSPGTEVSDEVASRQLEEGYGIVDKDNIHIVNVISGSIRVTKEITPELVSDTDQQFHFILRREEDGTEYPLTVTVPAGQATGSATVSNLARGTYLLTETPSEVFNVRAVDIEDDTNCHSVSEAPTATFRIGWDPDNRNVIGKQDGARYTDYTGAPNGVFGAARVTNEKTVYYGQIPVEKVWGDGPDSHTGDAVYLVLYLDGQLVLDTAGNARVLRLDGSNNWQGTFSVPLSHKDEDPAALGYTVREAARAEHLLQEGWQPAILEQDGTPIWYNAVIGQEGLFQRGTTHYMVTYDTDAATGAVTVTNHVAYVLPQTGGMGTTMYTISGLLLLLAAALMYGYSRRRRSERGPVS